VSVLGLGAMGAALVRAFLDAGHPTTVWNRTPARADSAARLGATVAADPAAAIAASELTVVCVLDRAAVDAILDAAGDALRHATVVNLTSSTPEDARAIAARVARSGAGYLDGKIMVPTPLIGTDDTLVLYSGDRAVFDRSSAILRSLGGDADLLGDDPGLAALYDLGMLDIFFNGMAAFLHAAALVGADGVEARRFLPYAQRITSVLQHTLPGLAADVDNRVHRGDEDNLTMELAALDHIVNASAARRIDPAVPMVPRALAAAAIAAGHGDDGFSRVIDVLRSQ
jgi:3-hydroxyisobutyrate dehydrogenase-like beta-hydroxyacid dehydrogenase